MHFMQKKIVQKFIHLSCTKSTFSFFIKYYMFLIISITHIIFLWILEFFFWISHLIITCWNNLDKKLNKNNPKLFYMFFVNNWKWVFNKRAGARMADGHATDTIIYINPNKTIDLAQLLLRTLSHCNNLVLLNPFRPTQIPFNRSIHSQWKSGWYNGFTISLKNNLQVILWPFMMSYFIY